MNPSRKLLEHALLLIARQHGGDPVAAQAAQEALRAWRQVDPAHETAAQAALKGWAATEAASLQGDVPLPSTQAERDQRTRRRIVSALGWAGLVMAVGGGSRWYGLQPVQQLALQTGRGQLLQRSLADGSVLDLAPQSRAEATLYRHRREVRLVQGEIRFDVRADADRPFEVATDWGRVRVLGTVFTVGVRDQRMSVAVARGRVAVWAGGRTTDFAHPPDAELTIGQSVRIDAKGMGAVEAVPANEVAAWRQGWLVFQQTPLPEVVARWNDYLTQPFTLAADPALRDLRLTGSFPVRDPGAFIGNLPKVLPVRVEPVAAGGGFVLSMR